MAMSDSLQSYPDCTDFFEKFVDDPKGGRLRIGTYQKAFEFRQRCNYARVLYRKLSKTIYPLGDVRYGTSEYDQFAFRLKEDTEGFWWIYAERLTIPVEEVELLSELDDGVPLIEAEFVEIKAIEDHSAEPANGDQASD